MFRKKIAQEIVNPTIEAQVNDHTLRACRPHFGDHPGKNRAVMYARRGAAPPLQCAACFPVKSANPESGAREDIAQKEKGQST